MTTKTEGQLFWLGYLLLLPLYLLPLGVTRFLPGLDLPLHLSLIDAVIKAGQAGTPHHEIYQAHFAPSGYFAYYFVLSVLAKWLPIQLAHRIIMGAVIALLPVACARLSRSYGTSQLPSLLAFPLAYNMPLHYGFVSFAFSIPILVLLVSQLVIVLRKERLLRRDAAYLLVLGLLLYVSHVQSYGFALVLAVGLIILCGISWRRRVLSGLALLPSVIVLGIWQSAGIFRATAQAPGKNLRHVLEGFWTARKLELTPPIQVLLDPLNRLFLFQVHLLRGFMDMADQVMSNLFLIALGTYICLGFFCSRREGQSPPRTLSSVSLRLLPSGLALCAYLALPHHIPEFQTIYPRVAVITAVLSFPLISQALLRCPRSWLRGLVLLSVGPALLYGIVLVYEYRRFDAELADFAAVLDATPAGGKAVGLVYGKTSSETMSSGSVLTNLPAYYPMERRSAQSLVPITFCEAPGSPCERKRGAKSLPALNPFQPGSLLMMDVVSYFDYFITHGAPPQQLLFGSLSDRIEPLAMAGKWTVYRKIEPALVDK